MNLAAIGFFEIAVGRLTCVVVLLVALNAHYVLLSRTLLEGALANPWLVGAANWCLKHAALVAAKRAGIHVSARRELYAPGRYLDVYGAGSVGVVYFHPGAWILGSRELGAAPLAYFNELGVAGYSVTYTLTSWRSSKGLRDALDDAELAVAYVAARHSRVVVAGDSAGGFLAFHVASRRAVAAVVAGWPVCTVLPEKWAPDDVTGLTPRNASDVRPPNYFVPQSLATDTWEYLRIHLFSATKLVCGRVANGWLPATCSHAELRDLELRVSSAPALVFAAQNDSIVPSSQVRLFASAYRKNNADFSLLVFDDADHGVGGLNSAAGRQALAAFLASHDLITSHTGDYAPLDALAAIMGNSHSYERGLYRPAEHARATLQIPRLD